MILLFAILVDVFGSSFVYGLVWAASVALAAAGVDAMMREGRRG